MRWEGVLRIRAERQCRFFFVSKFGGDSMGSSSRVASVLFHLDARAEKAKNSRFPFAAPLRFGL